MRKCLSAGLMGTVLLLAACGDSAAPAPTAVVVTPTAAVVQQVTPDTPTAAATTAVTDTTGMTGTTELTETTGVTDPAAVTATDGLTDTANLTEPGSVTATDAVTTLTAIALLHDVDGNPVGEATFTEDEDGVTIEVELQGLAVATAGEHGIHIHTMGTCEPDFQAAGDHFNPTGGEHGLENHQGPHAGDLPNIEIDGEGNASYVTTNPMLQLSEGSNSILDADGSAFMIHAGPDDMVTDPSGDSGDRIACGVIERQ
ncbi:MAG: superoxide dismutase family protein [Caldilineaceae bacterium]|nr:superoxide dismutase family protein [Caldilineaceae bacterium]